MEIDIRWKGAATSTFNEKDIAASTTGTDESLQ